jgi:DNA-binding response OmpR family regulator
VTADGRADAAHRLVVQAAGRDRVGTLAGVGHTAEGPPAAFRGNVLVVDDEPMVQEVVATYLERDGWNVTGAADGATALRMISSSRPDLVVLDLMLPLVDGLSVLARLRETTDVPVIVLTARGEEPDRVLGLELGADDYVVKPFSPRELVARVRSVLRRNPRSPSVASRIAVGRLVIDGASREVSVDGALVPLTAREFDLLAFLAASPRQVFSRADLLRQVWDSSPEYQDPSTVTVHVRRLRQKIEVDPNQPRHLVNVWGVGYRFDP